MKKLMILAAVALAACGVDGEPVQPSGGVNVSLSRSGTSLGANVGLAKGPVSIGVGL